MTKEELIERAGWDLIGDLVGYETLIRVILEYDIDQLSGDFIEIGCFLGGGSNKLARLAKVLHKKIICVDPFDILIDNNETVFGNKFNEIYNNTTERLGISKDQFYVFSKINGNVDNIEIFRRRSQDMVFRNEQKFSFGFIDGEHSYEAVRHDFKLVWRNLNEGGIIAFHDYNGDIPEVTKGINEILEEYKNYIVKTFEKQSKRLLFIQKES